MNWSRVPVENQASSYYFIHWAELTFVYVLPSEIMEKCNPKHEDQTWRVSLSTQLHIPHQLVGLASRTMFSCWLVLLSCFSKGINTFYFSYKHHRHKQLWYCSSDSRRIFRTFTFSNSSYFHPDFYFLSSISHTHVAQCLTQDRQYADGRNILRHWFK